MSVLNQKNIFDQDSEDVCSLNFSVLESETSVISTNAERENELNQNIRDYYNSLNQVIDESYFVNFYQDQENLVQNCSRAPQIQEVPYQNVVKNFLQLQDEQQIPGSTIEASRMVISQDPAENYTQEPQLEKDDPPTKRTRKTYSSHQLLELEREFHQSNYLNRTRKIKIAQTLDLSERQVKTWFQNRRMKQRKGQKTRNLFTDVLGGPRSVDSSSSYSSSSSSHILTEGDEISTHFSYQNLEGISPYQNTTSFNCSNYQGEFSSDSLNQSMNEFCNDVIKKITLPQRKQLMTEDSLGLNHISSSTSNNPELPLNDCAAQNNCDEFQNYQNLYFNQSESFDSLYYDSSPPQTSYQEEMDVLDKILEHNFNPAIVKIFEQDGFPLL